MTCAMMEEALHDNNYKLLAKGMSTWGLTANSYLIGTNY